ncbi:MAG: D-tyrosyl-tRNA(Tyr) deacylase [Gammaproteobacteria bacterium]|nr:D-tyrosyl-tRNA(Tyr) deacylase [Gammaproteobacteria bacterium]MBK8133345.1 D-tyrosyl-tRNA(Tyr) deacylase [Gammaproteobacteria bacterium]MBK9426153.1 D-tyrosyl-tRNA(Tyr) deacylase [Gammaproteobacteria bacterium]
MRGLLQRVRRAAVVAGGAEVGAIQQGVLLLVGIAPADTVASADTLLDRVLRYRLFPDAQGRMNLSLADIGGGLLIVSQFTLMADTRKGLRPSFTPAAPPELAERLYNHFVARAQERHAPVACGVFGADMQVALVNDGPVTLLLEV